MEKDLLDLTSLTKEGVISIINLAEDVKENPEKYSTKLKGKTLLMIFEKASLRTRISFEVGMTQLGGHAIYYNVADSPMGKGESIGDTAKTSSRYVNLIMARVKHTDLIQIAEHASVPVINAMTDFTHPCQILGDFLTIKEKKGKLEGLKLAFVGDGNNNIVHSLLYGCPLVGIKLAIATPDDKKLKPQDSVVETARALGGEVTITTNAEEAVKDADIVMADTWVSYYTPKEEKEARLKIFQAYQVNEELLKHAKEDAIFMHCLPAVRGMEMTEDVIDGPQSIVFDQAENRLHIQKAIMLKLVE